MDHSDASMEGIHEGSGALVSRRRVLQGAALTAAGITVGRLGSPLTAWADGGGGDGGRGGRGGDGEHGRNQEASTILAFSTMAGIQKPFTGATFLGVAGGGAPWVISQGSGQLSADGRLEVRVRGLVLDPSQVPTPPKGPGGTNPIAKFMAIVVGFSTDLLTPVAVPSSLVPASTTGDADIEETLMLPHPFYAPVLFVASLPIGTPAQPRWFAVTGRL